MITPSQYTRAYEAYQRILLDEAKRIADSTECRAYLNKNLEHGDAEDLLGHAVRCIADLTGDRSPLKALERRRHEQKDYDGTDGKGDGFRLGSARRCHEEAGTQCSTARQTRRSRT